MTSQGEGVWFSGPRQAEIRTEEVRDPGPREVLIEAIVSLISSGTEMVAYRGQFVSREEAGLDRPGRGGDFPFPVKYGYQVVGRVVEAGKEAPYSVGQRVFAVHPHQTRFVLPTDPATSGGKQYVYPIPDFLDSERAAYTNLYGVALNALLDAPVRVGDCVVVSGLGVVGMFLAQLARLTAARLVLIDPREDRRALASTIGADAVVGPDEAPEVIASLTGGRGSDLYFEASGAPAALQSAIVATGQEGAVVVVSYYGNRKVELTLSPEFHFRRIKLLSTLAGHITPEIVPRWAMARRVAESMRRLSQLNFELTPRRFAFADAARAYQAVDQAAGEPQGVLLDYTPSDSVPRNAD